jgi:hypothetical protein
MKEDPPLTAALQGLESQKPFSGKPPAHIELGYSTMVLSGQPPLDTCLHASTFTAVSTGLQVDYTQAMRPVVERGAGSSFWQIDQNGN